MLDKIEVDRERAPLPWQGWRAEAARRRQQGDVPPMIDHGVERERNLARHLGPAVQGLAAAVPGGKRKLRPCGMLRHVRGALPFCHRQAPAARAPSYTLSTPAL